MCFVIRDSVPLFVNQCNTEHIAWHVLCLVAQSCLTLCNPMDCSLPGSTVHGDSPRKNTGVGCHALLQGIFPTQGLNPGLPHCWQLLYHLSRQGSPRILEWVAYSFSRGSSWLRNRTKVSCIAGAFLTSWATREVCMACSLINTCWMKVSSYWMCESLSVCF